MDKFFIGDIEESINNMIRVYKLLTDQLQLSDTRKVLFFVNILKESTMTLSLKNITDKMNLSQIKFLMLHEFDSADRQKEAQRRLHRLRLQSFMTESDITDDSIGLSNIFAYIYNLSLSPKCLKMFRHEDSKLKILSSPVVSYESSKIPRYNGITGNHTYRSFKTALAH